MPKTATERAQLLALAEVFQSDKNPSMYINPKRLRRDIAEAFGATDVVRGGADPEAKVRDAIRQLLGEEELDDTNP